MHRLPLLLSFGKVNPVCILIAVDAGNDRYVAYLLALADEAQVFAQLVFTNISDQVVAAFRIHVRSPIQSASIIICSSNSDFSTMAPAPASQSFLFLSALSVRPQLLTIIGFLSFNPAKVVSNVAMIVNFIGDK